MRPHTLNPIPVGTRIIVLRAPFNCFPEHVGATGIVTMPYRQFTVLRPSGQVLYPWVYGALLDRFPPPCGIDYWAFEHGDIVPIAPPDEVIVADPIEVAA